MTSTTLTRDDARAAFSNSHLRISDLRASDLARLRVLIDENLAASGYMDGTLRIDETASQPFWIRCKSHYFDNREGVTFYGNMGFIGFAGWSDEVNIQPILAAFVAWVGETKDRHRSSAGAAMYPVDIARRLYDHPAFGKAHHLKFDQVETLRTGGNEWARQHWTAAVTGAIAATGPRPEPEHFARALYEYPEWGYKQPWGKNPRVCAPWRQAAADVLREVA